MFVFASVLPLNQRLSFWPFAKMKEFLWFFPFPGYFATASAFLDRSWQHTKTLDELLLAPRRSENKAVEIEFYADWRRLIAQLGFAFFPRDTQPRPAQSSLAFCYFHKSSLMDVLHEEVLPWRQKCPYGDWILTLVLFEIRQIRKIEEFRGMKVIIWLGYKSYNWSTHRLLSMNHAFRFGVDGILRTTFGADVYLTFHSILLYNYVQWPSAL